MPKLVPLAVVSCFITSAALANPIGPAVVRGTVAFKEAGKLLQITNSPNSVINWQSFSIGANEIARFIQQSSASAVLNRVATGDPSVILGGLQSNGRVFLINPNGIVFGAGAQIDVAGLVASSLNISNADFRANRLRFTGVAGAGPVVNQMNSNINAAPGGGVYLVGPAVTNSGIITSPAGEVILAAGNAVELVNPGTPNLKVEIAAPDNQALNLGKILAQSGRIGIYAGLINQAGTLRADSVVAGKDGSIKLVATKNVTLEPTSTISASGARGGSIAILAGDTAQVAGRLDASAPSGGDGGFIETSGKNRVTVDPATVVTTAAPRGKAGVWLIDLDNFIIAASGGDITGAALGSNLDTASVVIASNDGATGGNGDIFVNDAVSWSSGNGLTLTARRNVVVNREITNPAGGAINLYAGWDNASPAATPTLLAAGGPGSQHIAVGGSMVLAGGSGAFAPATIVGGGEFTPQQIIVRGDVVLMGGSGLTSHAYIVGPRIKMTVGGRILMTGTDPNQSARIAANTADHAIRLFFPNRTSGGYTVNGMEGVTYDFASGSGFDAGNAPAISGRSLFIAYAPVSVPVPPEVHRVPDSFLTDVINALEHSMDHDQLLWPNKRRFRGRALPQ